MSDYGSPGGSAGPQNPYGSPPGGQGTSSYPAATSSPKPAGDPTQMAQIVNWVALGLGVLGFIWGFLDWLSVTGGGSGSGFATIGGAAVGLTLASGLVAGGAALESKDAGLVPAGLAAAALLVTIGQLASHGDGYSVSIGLYLILITTILQTGGLIYGWLLASGRMAAPSSSPKPAQSPWAGQGGQGYGGYQSPGVGFGGQQYSPQGQSQGQPQGQPQSSSSPSGAPQSSPYGSPGQYGPPPGAGSGPQSGSPYGPPPSPPGYGPPPSQPPSSAPAGQPPSSQPPSSPYQPPSQSEGNESGGGYGEATRHIPRYTGPGSESSGQDRQG